MDNYINILEYEIKRLTEAMKSLDSINVIDYNTITIKKNMQKRINKGYSLLIDVKMDLERILKEVQE